MGSGSNTLARLSSLGVVIKTELMESHPRPATQNEWLPSNRNPIGVLPIVHVPAPFKPACVCPWNSSHFNDFASRVPKYTPFTCGELLDDFAREGSPGPLRAPLFVSLFCAGYLNLFLRSFLHYPNHIIGGNWAL